MQRPRWPTAQPSSPLWCALPLSWRCCDACRCMKWGGQVLVIGFASGKIPTIAANIVLVKNLTLHGVYWGMYLKNAPDLLRNSMQQLLAWAADGRLAVPVCARFPLEQVQDAIGMLFGRQAIGKVTSAPVAAQWDEHAAERLRPWCSLACSPAAPLLAQVLLQPGAPARAARL